MEAVVQRRECLPYHDTRISWRRSVPPLLAPAAPLAKAQRWQLGPVTWAALCWYWKRSKEAAVAKSQDIGWPQRVGWMGCSGRRHISDQLLLASHIPPCHTSGLQGKMVSQDSFHT
jgi:hypothetical protein